MAKRGKDLDRLKAVVTQLAQGVPLAPRHRDHPLTGGWHDCCGCHIEPDWVLIHSVDEESLRLERTGTHSDLFRR